MTQAEQPEKEKTTGVATQASANGQPIRAATVYIPDWAGVKLDGQIY